MLALLMAQNRWLDARFISNKLKEDTSLVLKKTWLNKRQMHFTIATLHRFVHCDLQPVSEQNAEHATGYL